MSTRGALTTVRRRLLGLALLMTIVLFLGMTVATYQKAFSSTVDVNLKAESTGNQLLPESDVKVRGMIVGSVREVRSSGGGAEMTLALDPDKVKQIPANVSARLLPKTLFGERYVSLELPNQPTSSTIAAGDVIQQDRTKSSVELEKVLSDTMPVLQAVHPEELASTLNSLNQALDGRGKSTGETLSQLNQYVAGLNPSLPDLRENMRQLVGVANTYQDAAPAVVDALNNMSATSRTLVDQRQNLSALTSQLTTTSNDTTAFLRANSNNLIRLGDAQRPTLDVLAKYSPAFPCFLKGMNDFIPKVNQAFGVGTNEPGLHITLEVVPNRGKYEPHQDEPVNGDRRGPRCYDFVNGPKPFPQYPPDGPVNDGSKPPPPARVSNGGLNPPAQGGAFIPQGSSAPAGNGPASNGPATMGAATVGAPAVGAPMAGAAQAAPASATPQSALGAGLGMANSPVERDLVSTLLAPSYGVPSSEVPQWGSLLVGPLLRGAEVSYR